MSARRDELIAWLDETLEASAFRDYCPNGLQVVGREEVDVVATAVSASLEVFERAGAAGAGLLLVHHGLFWDGASPVVRELERRRLEALFRHDLTLAAYHLPLDAHPVLGNNAQLLALLGVERHEPWADVRGRPIARHGSLPGPSSIDEVAAQLGSALGSQPLVLRGGDEPVRRIGALSGAGGGEARAAAELGLDCLVTGEPEEYLPYLARELGLHIVCAGHHATETVGVQALAGELARQFAVETIFLGVENPV